MNQVLSEQDVRDAGGIVHRDGNVFFTNIDKLNAAILAKLADRLKDAERYRFIRDADRSGCIDTEIALYAMESLDECVDAAMEGEAAIDAQKGRQ